MLSLPCRYFWLSVFVTVLCSEMSLISILLHRLPGLLELAWLWGSLVSECLHVLYLHISKGVIFLGF